MKTPEQVKQKLADWYAHQPATGGQYAVGFKVGMVTALEWVLDEEQGEATE